MTMDRETEDWSEQLLSMGFTAAQVQAAANAGVSEISAAIDHITNNPNPITDTSDKHSHQSQLIVPSSTDAFPPLRPDSNRPSGLSNARNSLDRIDIARSAPSSQREVTTITSPSPAQDDDLTRALEISRKEQHDLDMQRALQISKQEGASAASADRDPMLVRALQESLMDNPRLVGDRNVSWQSQAFGTATDRIRASLHDPVGLRNIGNTCYLNSLLQVYYHLPEFRRAIMSFRPHDSLLQPTASPNDSASERKSDTTADCKLPSASPDVEMAPADATAQPQNSPVNEQTSDKSDNQTAEQTGDPVTKNAVSFVVELQKLFAAMALGNQNCADPTGVTRAMRDPEGKPIEIGDQQDASEFNHLFLDIVEKGLQAEPINPEQPSPDPVPMSTPPPSSGETSAARNIVKDMFTVKFRQEVRSCMESEADVQDEDMSPIVTDGETNCIIVDATNSEGRNLHNGLDDYAVARIDYKVSPGDEKGGTVAGAVEGMSNEPTNDTEKDAPLPATVTEIETLPNGMISASRPAMKRVWFTNLPPVMVIYLQRVRFNREKSLAEKVHSKYEFGTDISFDRYLEDNREASAQVRERVLGIRKERRRLLSVIRKYRHFPEGMRDKVASTLDCNSGERGDNDVEMGEGSYFEAVSRIQERLRQAICPAAPMYEVSGLSKKAIESALETMESISDSDRKQCESYESDLRALEDENEAYRELERRKYPLHAVLVHDGAPSSGHYWTFIRDWSSTERDKIWMKFSDSLVSRVSEEDMLRWSLGGHGTASAYCLIYITSGATDVKGSVSISEESKDLLPQIRLDEVGTLSSEFMKEVDEAKRKVVEPTHQHQSQEW